ncbi:MAG: TIGR03668 family PPOX class F420-dependent oxidoreductase, partial [Actinomycetota bacterium]|nr:TIGR03668 family PPOX class F420-dependent oxidoreductase [Actinomycetota bacterium]
HLVPIVFALDDERMYTAIDDKPKRSRDLQRLANIAADPRVSVLVDSYDEDWSRLWWVRVDGRAEILDEGAGKEREHALDLLAAKYEAYRSRRPSDAVVGITISRWTAWPEN